MSVRPSVRQIKTRLTLRFFDVNGQQNQRSVVVKGKAEEHNERINAAQPGERLKFVKSDQYDEEANAFYAKEDIISVEDFVVR